MGLVPGLGDLEDDEGAIREDFEVGVGGEKAAIWKLEERGDQRLMGNFQGRKSNQGPG